MLRKSRKYNGVACGGQTGANRHDLRKLRSQSNGFSTGAVVSIHHSLDFRCPSYLLASFLPSTIRLSNFPSMVLKGPPLVGNRPFLNSSIATSALRSRGPSL